MIDEAEKSRTQFRELPMASLLSILAFLVLACDQAPSGGEKAAIDAPPNLVLLVGDDQGYPDFGFMGNEIVRTPNLDRLASEGTVFTQAHSTSNLGRPAHWTLLTGLYPHQIHHVVQREAGVSAQTGRAGMHQWSRLSRGYTEAIRRDHNSLPRALARAGYVSFEGGKFWEESHDVAGFSEGMTVATQGAGKKGRAFPAQAGGAGLKLGRETLEPVFEFIKRHRDGPFFVWYTPSIPHVPHNPPARLRDLYKEDDLSKSARLYYAECSWFDEGVGQLVDFLERRGLRNDTLLVYLSDNGWQQDPDADYGHFLGGPLGKLSLHEQAFRTPIIFNWPGHIPAGEIREDLVSAVDLYATLLDYAGVEVAGDRPGRSLQGLLAGRSSEHRKHLIGSTTFVRVEEKKLLRRVGGVWARQNAFYVTTPDWHYVWNETLDTQVLFDRRRDPREERDLVAENPELARAFRERIEAWKVEIVRPFEED